MGLLATLIGCRSEDGRPDPRTRNLRTRPDPHSDTSDLVRKCLNPARLAVFTSCEAPVSVMEKPQEGAFDKELAARIGTMSADSREALL